MLRKFPLELEVTITDGIECNCYHTDGIEIQIFKETKRKKVLDIGVGGLRYNEKGEKIKYKL